MQLVDGSTNNGCENLSPSAGEPLSPPDAICPKIRIMRAPLLLFAHGAGAGSSHPWMQHWALLLRALGRVEMFDYPYMTQKGRRPDPLPRLLGAHRAALNEARRGDDAPVVLIGKSMGSRVGCHLALDEPVQAVVCLGYPLCGGGKPEKMRDAVLRKLTTPTLFVQGTRDPLCPLDLLEDVRREMPAPNEVCVVEGGDHSLRVTKSHLKAREETQEEVDLRIVQIIQRFLSSHLPPGDQAAAALP